MLELKSFVIFLVSIAFNIVMTCFKISFEKLYKVFELFQLPPSRAFFNISSDSFNSFY